MYFEMVKYEMVFISAVKTLTCSNRWQLDWRCCWCGSGLNRTRKGDHVNNELSDRSFWEKNHTDFRLFISVSPHRSNADSQYLCSSSRECCKTSLLHLLCLFNCIIKLFSIPVPQLWARSCCTSTAWTVSSGMLRQYSGCTRLLDRR